MTFDDHVDHVDHVMGCLVQGCGYGYPPAYGQGYAPGTPGYGAPGYGGKVGEVRILSILCKIWTL